MNKDHPSFVCYFFLRTCYRTNTYYFWGFDALGEIWHCRNDCCCHFKCSVFVVTWKWTVGGFSYLCWDRIWLYEGTGIRWRVPNSQLIIPLCSLQASLWLFSWSWCLRGGCFSIVMMCVAVRVHSHIDQQTFCWFHQPAVDLCGLCLLSDHRRAVAISDSIFHEQWSGDGFCWSVCWNRWGISMCSCKSVQWEGQRKVLSNEIQNLLVLKWFIEISSLLFYAENSWTGLLQTCFVQLVELRATDEVKVKV